MNEQMGLHQTKELLHSKGKSPDSRDSPQNGIKSLAATHPTRVSSNKGDSKNSIPKE
jgi:hypothetical protein